MSDVEEEDFELEYDDESEEELESSLVAAVNKVSNGCCGGGAAMSDVVVAAVAAAAVCCLVGVVDTVSWADELEEFCLDIRFLFVGLVGVVAEAGGFLLISFLAVNVGPLAEADAEELELRLPLWLGVVLRGRPLPFLAPPGAPKLLTTAAATGGTKRCCLLKSSCSSSLVSGARTALCACFSFLRGFLGLACGVCCCAGGSGLVETEGGDEGRGSIGIIVKVFGMAAFCIIGGERGKAVMAAGTPGICRVPPGPRTGRRSRVPSSLLFESDDRLLKPCSTS